jgi:hypothetical protein
MQGYYSVIQYRPDTGRAEAANVGIVLYTESPRQLEVKMSATFARVDRFFQPDREKLSRIIESARSTADRLMLSVAEMDSVADLDHFARTLGNDIAMTPPRMAAVENIVSDISRLFDQLVGDEADRKHRKPAMLPTAINQVFEQLASSGKVWQPGRVKIPLNGRSIDIPYAYRNGVLNYVKPVVFSHGTQRIDDKACRLAVEGDQIRKDHDHRVEGVAGRQLVIVSASASDSEAESRVAPVFKEYGVVYIPRKAAEEFARKVMLEAK